MAKKVDKRTKCPVTDYARRVVAGKIVAGELVRLACQRHLTDLESCHARGLYFDRTAAEHVIDKMQLFRLAKAGGQQMMLTPAFKFIAGSLMGWKRADGTRRFREADIEVAKKNGKSTFLGALSIYMLYFDGESGAEVYAAATTRDQARIVFDEAVNMLRAMPAQWAIRQKLQIMGKAFAHGVAYVETASRMAPLSADADTIDGKNPHFVTVDEFHRHKTADVRSVLKKSMVTRRQPLLVSITTAGYDKHSPCWKQREYAVQVLNGLLQDDAYFAYIATLDEGDNWQDEAVWEKANPNIGVSVTLEALREEARKAAAMPTALNDFLRYHMNVWTDAAKSWIPPSMWAECEQVYDLESLRGRPCFGALDLSKSRDLSAFCLVFPPQAEGEKWKFLAWFWLPGENMRDRVERDRVPYDVWIRDGLIKTTVGNSIDYDVIEADILDLCQLFEVQDIAYDRMFATQIVTNLQAEGVTMTEFGQGFYSMAAPTQYLEDIIYAKDIAHNGNPVMAWMLNNVALRFDPAGNKKPDKERSREKIDGIVALIMALGRAIVTAKPQAGYTATHGIMII